MKNNILVLAVNVYLFVCTFVTPILLNYFNKWRYHVTDIKAFSCYNNICKLYTDIFSQYIEYI